VTTTGGRPPRTGPGDTLLGIAAVTLSLGLLAFGEVVLLASQRGLHHARAQLGVEVLQQARAQQLSPRDASVLRAVQRRLPRDVKLIPSRDVLSTGRVEIVSRLPAADDRECLVLPVSSDGRVVSCPAVSSRPPTGAGRRTSRNAR